jgi:ABC-2 type transport system permease protein
MKNTYQLYIGFKTIVIYEIIRFTRIWMQTLLPPVITMSLYFIIFGNFVGSRLAPVHGVTFMQYIAPGLIMMAIISNSFANVVSSLYSLRFQHSIEELVVSPLPNSLMLIGFCVGGILRGLFVGFLVAFIALFFTHLYISHIGITIFITVLTATFFSLAGFTNALYARNFDDISIIPTFVLTPLTYLGGVFFSVSQLPHSWQIFTLFNPILYLVNTFRYGMLGLTDISVSFALLLICLGIIFLFTLNLHLLRKGVGIRT